MSIEYKQGLLELDYKQTEATTDKTVQALIERTKLPGLRKILTENPLLYNKLHYLENFKSNSLIKDLLDWLDSFKTRVRAIEQICKIRGLNYKSITIQQLIKFYYSYLIDASFLRYVSVIDKKGNISNLYIQVLGALNITKNSLTNLAEHARLFRKHEISGFLSGIRNPDGSIQEITQYIPVTKGTETHAVFNQIDLIRTIKKLNNINEALVGFCHSHPNMGAPVFSSEDKRTHLFFAKVCSTYHYFSELNIHFSDYRIFKLSFHLANYKIAQIKFILAAIRTMLRKRLRIPFGLALIHFSRNLSFVTQIKNDYTFFIMKDTYNANIRKDIQERLNIAYNDLKEKLQNILNKFKIEPETIEFNMLPFAGAVICPRSRNFGIVDIDYDNNTRNKWFYYRIIGKK